MTGTEGQAFKSCLYWGSSNLITECPTWDKPYKESLQNIGSHFFFLRGQSRWFLASFPIFAPFWVKTAWGTCHIAHCFWLETPQPVSILFNDSVFMKGSGASFSTRLTNQSEHNLPPDSFKENASDWPCLLRSQWLPQHCRVGQECGFLIQTIHLLPFWLGPWLHPVLEGCSFCQLPLRAPKCPHKPHAQNTPFRFVCLQIPVCLVPEQAGRAIKATAVQFPTENFLPISEWECVCVCVYLRVSKKKKTNNQNILVLCTKHFWGRYGAL